MSDNKANLSSSGLSLNLEKPEDLAFTYPTSVKYGRYPLVLVDTWRALYAELMSLIAKQYPAYFLLDSIEPALPADEISDLKGSKKLKAPANVRRGIYIETGLSTDKIIRRIKSTLEVCGEPYSVVKIMYDVNEEEKTRHAERRAAAAAKPKEYTLDWNRDISYTGAQILAYRIVPQRTRQVNTWTKLYVELMSELRANYPKKIRKGISFTSSNQPDIVADNKMKLLQKPADIGNGLYVETYGTTTLLVSKMYKAMHLCGFDTDRLTVRFGFNDPEKEKAYCAQLPSTKPAKQNKPQPNTKQYRRCNSILEANFENGFRSASMRDLERFKLLYKEEFGALKLSDQQLIEYLTEIGATFDGRIYSSAARANSTLTESILEEVAAAFDSGATGVYAQAIFDKRHDAIVSELKIFSAKALAEYLIEASNKRYTLKREVLCYGRTTPNAKKEIESFVSNAETAVALSEIVEALWYIPKTVIDRILHTSDKVVEVTSDRFYYAPNLPINRDEKKTIADSIAFQLRLKESIGEMELLSIVQQVCPSFLQSIEFLSWKAVKQSLAIVFSDNIVASSAGFLRKGM